MIYDSDIAQEDIDILARIESGFYENKLKPVFILRPILPVLDSITPTVNEISLYTNQLIDYHIALIEYNNSITNYDTNLGYYIDENSKIMSKFCNDLSITLEYDSNNELAQSLCEIACQEQSFEDIYYKMLSLIHIYRIHVKLMNPKKDRT